MLPPRGEGLGAAAWGLTPAQVVFRVADLDARESGSNVMRAYVARAAQAEEKGFKAFVGALGG